MIRCTVLYIGRDHPACIFVGCHLALFTFYLVSLHHCLPGNTASCSSDNNDNESVAAAAFINQCNKLWALYCLWSRRCRAVRGEEAGRGQQDSLLTQGSSTYWVISDFLLHEVTNAPLSPEGRGRGRRVPCLAARKRAHALPLLFCHDLSQGVRVRARLWLVMWGVRKGHCMTRKIPTAPLSKGKGGLKSSIF